MEKTSRLSVALRLLHPALAGLVLSVPGPGPAGCAGAVVAQQLSTSTERARTPRAPLWSIQRYSHTEQPCWVGARGRGVVREVCSCWWLCWLHPKRALPRGCAQCCFPAIHSIKKYHPLPAPPFNSLLKRSFVNGLDSQVACKVFLPGEGAVGFAHKVLGRVLSLARSLWDRRQEPQPCLCLAGPG